MGMQVQVTNPKLQAKVEQWVSDTGRPAEELFEDAVAGYLDGMVETRQMLDSRYDDVKSGRVKLIPGDEVVARLRERSEAHRQRNA